MRSFFCDAIRYELAGHRILEAVLPDQDRNEVTSSLDLNNGIGIINGGTWAGSAVTSITQPLPRLALSTIP
jgi:hypothetical protein